MPTRAKTRKSEKEQEEALELLRTQIQDITEDLWRNGRSNFYDARAFDERVKNREERIELDDKFKEYAQGIQILSNIVRDDLATNVQLLNLDQPRLDTISQETATDAKRDVEEARMWLSNSMDIQNAGKTLGRGINTDQWMKGVACVEKRWRYPDEPGEDYFKSAMGEDYYDPADTKELDPKKADLREDARKAHFQSSHEHPFYMNLVNMNEMSWGPKLLDPDVYLRQFQLSYTEARKLVKKTDGEGKGKKLSLSDSGKQFYFGESESDENGDHSQQTSKYFDVVIRNHREGEDWICTEWIKCADNDWTDGEMYDEYVIPFGRPMYFIIPSGEMNPTATNPHVMYGAPIHSEVVLVYERNYINTLKVVLARMQLTDNFMYLPGNKLNSDVLTQAEAAGFVFEGAGEQRGMVLRRSNTDADQIAVMPGEIAAWPFPDIKSLDLRLAQIEMELDRIRPNRFQIGQAIGAAKEGTAYGIRDQKQASAVPYEAHIDYEEDFWAESAEAERNAIIYWAEQGGTQKPFFYKTTGKEPAMGGSMEPGKEIEIDADKMKRDFVVFVEKRNVTQDEEYQSHLMAYEDKKQGTLTREQLLKKLGYPDPQKQLEELRMEQNREMAEQELEPARRMMVKIYASAIAGVNLSEVPLPAGMPAPGVNPQKPPSPNQPAAAQQYQPQQAYPPAQGIGSFGSQADPTMPV